MRYWNTYRLEPRFCRMIDPKILKERPELLRDMLRRRRLDFPLDELIELDKNRRQLISSRQDIRHRKNVISEQISNKKKEKQDIITELEDMKDIRMKMKQLDGELSTVEYRFNELMLSIPNLLVNSCPTVMNLKINRKLEMWVRSIKRNLIFLINLNY